MIYTASHYEEFRKGYEMGYSHGYMAGIRNEEPRPDAFFEPQQMALRIADGALVYE